MAHHRLIYPALVRRAIGLGRLFLDERFATRESLLDSAKERFTQA
jgi:hypothetical protein